MKRFQAPKDCQGVSLGGVYYTADKKGIVTIPHDNHADLINHGFEPIDDSDNPDALKEIQKAAEAEQKAREKQADADAIAADKAQKAQAKAEAEAQKEAEAAAEQARVVLEAEKLANDAKVNEGITAAQVIEH